MKIKLSEFLPEQNTFCVNHGMIALLLKQIDDEILSDDIKNKKDDCHFLGESSYTFTLDCVYEYLNRYINFGYEYKDDDFKEVEIPKNLFDYRFLDENVALYKIGARRDSDELYPIIQIFGICECKSEKEYDEDYLLEEIKRTVKCLMDLIKLCYLYFDFINYPKDGQYFIYDVIDYQCLDKPAFDIKRYLEENYNIVVTKEELFK